MPEKHPLVQAIDYIVENWREIRTLRSVAEKFCVDPGNLSRAFRDTRGITAKQYIDGKKKRYVLARLKSSETLYYEIGYELGFRRDYAFARWAKRVFGISLTEFQRNRKHKK